MDKKTHFGFEEVNTSEKQQRVDGVFNSVAAKYDLMNDLLSMGTHRLWKRQMINKAHLLPGQTILDLAGGTGDIAALMAPKVGDNGQIVIADINNAMLKVGRDRLLDKGLFKNLEFIQANGEILPFLDNTFDRITLAFGIRNFPNKPKALKELYRVLKPGGRLIILEFTTPTLPLITNAYDFYSFNILPKIGEIVTNDAKSYQYLAESIRMHPKQDDFKAMIQDAGFEDCAYQNLSLGIVAIHTGIKY